jgi:hypothetical protein
MSDMDTDSIIMLLIGATFLLGGVAVSVAHYLRASRRDTA